jgi:outer membrane protein OmpA-like peptidoglycan-associated protein
MHSQLEHRMRMVRRPFFCATMLCCLAACTATQPEPDQAPNQDPAQDQKNVSIESPQPDWTRTDSPVSAVASPPANKSSRSKIAVLDPSDVDAPAQHRQELLQNSEDPLEDSEVGYYIDILEARMIQQVREDGMNITRQGNTFTVVLAGSNVFASNRSKLEPEAQQSLVSITAVLEEYRNTRISIYGHTDDVGEERYNQVLSQRRAQSVADYLVKGGVAAQRIVIIGYGESQPLADNASAEGRARNRRIELLLEPLAE